MPLVFLPRLLCVCNIFTLSITRSVNQIPFVPRTSRSRKRIHFLQPFPSLLALPCWLYRYLSAHLYSTSSSLKHSLRERRSKVLKMKGRRMVPKAFYHLVSSATWGVKWEDATQGGVMKKKEEFLEAKEHWEWIDCNFTFSKLFSSSHEIWNQLVWTESEKKTLLTP